MRSRNLTSRGRRLIQIGLLLTTLPIAALIGQEASTASQIAATRETGRNARREFQTNRRVKDFYRGNTYYASVEKIEPLPGGMSQVTFHNFEGPLAKYKAHHPNDSASSEVTATLAVPQPSVRPLVWVDSAGAPPGAPGMRVLMKIDREGQVDYLEYGLEEILALRQRPDRRWEILAVVGNTILQLLPNRTDLGSSEIIWTRKHGLLHSTFYSEYGGGETEERDSLLKSRGYPIANLPGTYLKPGRDGWLDYKTFASPAIARVKADDYGEQRRIWAAAIVPPSQYIESNARGAYPPKWRD